MKKLSLTLVCAAVALGATMAHAADDAKHMDVRAYKALDKDGDKRISRDEAQGHAMLSKHFDQMDDDKDGFLNAKEVRSFARAHKGKGFDKVDKNNDNVITRDEVANNPKLAKRFDAADTDKDGKLTKEEAKAYHHDHKK
ncbi:MAG: hypothetical protein C4K60_02770 [Ideonella sp. MAG2]|nr:MAG: hypothetical protein C4K60_02770 [Ideonella sp. MAG2]